MATIEEALRAARGLVIAFTGPGEYSDAQVREFHALLTDLNYHTEAALLLARRMGEEQIALELERIAALRDQRGSLSGLAADGTRLRDKRDALVSEVERLWARGHRRSAGERNDEVALEDALKRAEHALDRAMVAASSRGVYAPRDAGVQEARAQRDAAKAALASSRSRYRSEGRMGNPRKASGDARAEAQAAVDAARSAYQAAEAEVSRLAEAAYRAQLRVPKALDPHFDLHYPAAKRAWDAAKADLDAAQQRQYAIGNELMRANDRLRRFKPRG